MKKFLLTALLVSFAFTGVVTTDGTEDNTDNSNPTTEENTNEGTSNESTTEENLGGEYDVMPFNRCDPIDCWGV